MPAGPFFCRAFLVASCQCTLSDFEAAEWLRFEYLRLSEQYPGSGVIFEYYFDVDDTRLSQSGRLNVLAKSAQSTKGTEQYKYSESDVKKRVFGAYP